MTDLFNRLVGFFGVLGMPPDDITPDRINYWIVEQISARSEALAKAETALQKLAVQRSVIWERDKDTGPEWGRHVSEMTDTARETLAAVHAMLKGQLKLRRVRHVTSLRTYQVIGEGLLQTSRPVSADEMITIYRCEDDGVLWPRPTIEFEDGRFIPLDDASP